MSITPNPLPSMAGIIGTNRSFMSTPSELATRPAGPPHGSMFITDVDIMMSDAMTSVFIRMRRYSGIIAATMTM